MGNVRKLKKEYIIEFYARGLLYQQKAGADKAKAKQMLQGIEQKIKNGELGTLERNVDIDVFLETFLSQCAGEHTAKSLACFRSSIKRFKEFLNHEGLAGQKLSVVTPAVVERYQSFLQGKQKSNMINLHLFLLREILDHAIKLGYLNDNPATHVRYKKMKATVKADAQSKAMSADLIEKSREVLRVLGQKLQSANGAVSGKEINCWVKALFKKEGITAGAAKEGVQQYLANELIAKGVRFSKLYQYLGMEDIAASLKYYDLG